MLLWPDALALFYVEPAPLPITNPRVFIGALLILVTALLPLLLWRTAPLLSIALLWIGLGLLPVSQLSPIQNLMADRYLLLPSIGYAILVALLVRATLKGWRLLLPVGYCFALAVLTLSRLPLWHNELLIWNDLIAKQPLEERGWTNKASFLIDEQRYTEAEEVLKEGFKWLPSNPLLTETMGGILLRKGSLLDAEQSLSFAWKQDKQLRAAANNLCTLYQKQQRLKEARHLAEELVALHPLYPTGWNTLGAISLEQQDFERSEQALYRAHALAPRATTPIINLGNLAYLRSDFSAAASWWQHALQLNPELEHPKKGLKALQLTPVEAETTPFKKEPPD
jgi:protein O-mannosyl-transferase